MTCEYCNLSALARDARRATFPHFLFPLLGRPSSGPSACVLVPARIRRAAEMATTFKKSHPDAMESPSHATSGITSTPGSASA